MKKILLTKQQIDKFIKNKVIKEQFAVPPPSDGQLNTTSMPDEANFSNDADFVTNNNLRSRVFFRNGSSISMQASNKHNCIPKDDEGPYKSIELGFPQGGIKLPEDFDNFRQDDMSSNIFSFVPASEVVKIIEMNNGVKSGEVPPFANQADQNQYPIGEEPGDATLRADANPMNAASDNLQEARKRMKEDFKRFL